MKLSVIPKLNLQKTANRAREYFLHTKISKTNVGEFNIPNCPLSKDACEFSYVKIGKESDSSFSKEVITFFDNSGKLLQQIFKTNGEDCAKRSYSYLGENSRRIDIFSGDGVKTSSEFQKIRVENNDKQLLTKRVNYLRDENNNPVLDIVFTHFPKIKDLRTHPKLVASAKVVERLGQTVLTDFKKSGFHGTFDVSKNDKYLLFRFLGLNTDEGLLAITKRFLKEKNIFRLKLNIRPSSGAIDSNSEGGFSVIDRAINYSPDLKQKSPLEVVNTAAHEVEHAYQYSQIGRLGKGRTSYETDAMRLLGDLEMEDFSEAIRYANARYNYPRISPGEDLSKNKAYLTNYLEVKAREAGKEAEDKYVKANMQNYLFFDLAYS
ncbi:MAG: hypothetical protein NC191_04585 [Muribaculaceae bacterium]|nr:hypothetical protein [Muribaculaceae bacterium]